MPEKDDKYEIYDVQSGPIVAFIGAAGFGGVLIHRPDSGWEFYPVGSTAWDLNHQAVFRNFRGDSLTLSDLEKRGIPPPPPVEQFANRGIMEWGENFIWEVSFSEVPNRCLEKLRAWPGGTGTFHIVLEEDEYETGLGDGEFLGLKAAFWDRPSAEKYLRGKEREGAIHRRRGSEYTYWYKHTLKEINARVDESRSVVAANAAIETFEHYGLDGILEELEQRMAWEESFNAEVPLSWVPKQVIEEIEAAGGLLTLYLILYEEYEKAFTEEGRHYLEAVFRSEKRARRYLKAREDKSCEVSGEYEEPERFWYLQDLQVTIDREHSQVKGDLVIDGYKGYSLEDILKAPREDPA